VAVIGTVENVLRRQVGDRVYFFGTINSDKVKGVTFVPVIEKSPKTPLHEIVEDGYQRPGSEPRMNKFKEFLKRNPESLVPPVILSGRGQWTYQPQSKGIPLGTLTIEGPAAILDGQHRLGGYVALYLESPTDVRGVDFLLLDNLNREQEIKEFVIVNNTQVGVPKSLGIHIGAGIEGLEKVLGELADEAWIAWELTTREDSPFQGRISRTKLGPEHLFNLASVAKHIQKMFKQGTFGDCEAEEKLEITIKYWNLIEQLHPREWADIEKLGVRGQGRNQFDFKLLELTGFIAWSAIASSQLLSTSYNNLSHTMDWERVQKMIEALANKIDWRKTGEYEGRTGEVGGPVIARDMEKVLGQNPL